MEIRGRVHNGVVVLEGGPPLPEGMVVTVSYPVPPHTEPPDSRRRVSLPLVRPNRPGIRRLRFVLMAFSYVLFFRFELRRMQPESTRGTDREFRAIFDREGGAS